MSAGIVKLRALEKSDLQFAHDLNNDRPIMNYWFEEPYESYVELKELYLKHIHDLSERRFIAEDETGDCLGLVELVEINYIHRRGEFQLIVAPSHQGEGYGQRITQLALDYAFCVLNLNKVFLLVATNNEAAIHIYKTSGFIEEGCLINENFVDGSYQNALRMYQLQADFLAKRQTNNAFS